MESFEVFGLQEGRRVMLSSTLMIEAQDAIREIDGRNGWRVELSHNSRGGGGDRGGGGGRGLSGGSDLKCYECGEAGHVACECRMRGGNAMLLGSVRATGRRRSPITATRYRRSPSHGRRRVAYAHLSNHMN